MKANINIMASFCTRGHSLSLSSSAALLLLILVSLSSWSEAHTRSSSSASTSISHMNIPRAGQQQQDDVHAEDNNNKPIDIVIGIDGGTESIRACCFNAQTGKTIGSSHAVPYKTSHPNAGWAEQSPEEWYTNLCQAVRGAVSTISSDSGLQSKNDGEQYYKQYNVKALCCDTTCCSVVALNKEHKPLRPCLLWMDARSAKQAAQIMDIANIKSKAVGDTDILQSFPELRVNSHGQGPISAEWLLPKAMWMKQNEAQVWEDAHVICEYQDYINYRLTGKMVASSGNAAVRWHHDGWEVLQADGDSENEEERHRGRPMKLYQALDMEDLADKLPRKTLAMGDVVGGLTEDAAKELGLPVGTKVVQGGPDAFVGIIGLGTIHPHQICLITGSSHLHCLLTPTATSAPGTWGAYRGAPLPHLNFAEGGQSSTGSLVRWVRDLTSGDAEEKISYEVMDEEASLVEPGCDGLVALETWQGSRTPHTDPLARGAFVGLTLSHKRAHMFRAILESVCYGTRSCFDALEAAAEQQSTCNTADESHTSNNEVVIAGGATRSELWLQLHADITGRTFLLNENTDGPLLGCAILASVGAGIHDSVDDAVANMVRRERRIEPRPEVKKVYDRLYEEVYLKVRPGVKGIVHAMQLRGGAISPNAVKSEQQKTSFDHTSRRTGLWGVVRGGSSAGSQELSTPIISPSLLAADWSDMKGEVQKCLDAGLSWMHVDVFDGVYLDSPHALTFGPQMVQCIRKRFAEQRDLTMDIHLCVERPERYAQAMAEAGATRIIFMWEAMESLDSAIEFAKIITSLGMECGVSINPDTAITDIYPLLESGFVDLVDILAVEPGFGGQQFNHVAMEKIGTLRLHREVRLRPRGIDVKILVDGGINSQTSSLVADAGADILVAGTALFRHPTGFEEAVKGLL